MWAVEGAASRGIDTVLFENYVHQPGKGARSHLYRIALSYILIGDSRNGRNNLTGGIEHYRCSRNAHPPGVESPLDLCTWITILQCFNVVVCLHFLDHRSY